MKFNLMKSKNKRRPSELDRIVFTTKETTVNESGHFRISLAISPLIISLLMILLFGGSVWSLESHAGLSESHVDLLPMTPYKEADRITVTVTSAADSGSGTLRQALLDAQLGDTIVFDEEIFPAASPITISLKSELPKITINELTIDASNAGVILAGDHLIYYGNGLTINGTEGVIIRGLQITGFPGNGIELEGASETIIQGNLISGNDHGVVLRGKGTINNRVEGNYIGPDMTGTLVLGHQKKGISIKNGANNNIIGGYNPDKGNLISGNSGAGIVLDGEQSSGNIVIGNHIGVDATCTSALENRNGIVVEDAPNNIIGGTKIGERNVISGNKATGIIILGSTARNNQIIGNYIGTNCSGIKAIGNRGGGISISLGSSENIVGGDNEKTKNVISGNSRDGVSIYGPSTMNNRILGNYIGTTISGSLVLSNTGSGIRIDVGASHNEIGGKNLGEGNIISGNADWGILISGENTVENRIMGNFIGPGKRGVKGLGNDEGGVAIVNAPRNYVGDDTGESYNIISGNNGDGIWISGNKAVGNLVISNYIGTDGTGQAALTNNGSGVQISGGASNNIVGAYTDTLQLKSLISGTSSLANVIGGNLSQGVLLGGDGTNDNQIIGNYIGIDSEDEGSVTNEIGIKIGLEPTVNVIENNLIQGNNSANLFITEGNEGNLVQNNTFQHRLDNGEENQLTFGSHLVNNKFLALNSIRVIGSRLTEDNTWTVQGDLNTYLIVEEELVIGAGTTLTIAAGVNLLFDFGLGMQVESGGRLIAEGSTTDTIRFTSAQRFANPVFGDWQGLTFAPDSYGSLHHTTVEFATNGLTLSGGDVSVMSSTIAASQYDGIVVPTGTLSLTLSLANNTLADNGQMAINNQSATLIISAPKTWWGSTSGPNHASNPAALGDVVSQNVNFQNWSQDPSPKDDWHTAPVLNPGSHAFVIENHREPHWFRIPVRRNTTLTMTLTPPEKEKEKDYDLFLFSSLEEASLSLDDSGNAYGKAQELPADPKNIGSTTCSSRYIRQVANLGRVNTERLLPPSCREEGETEEVTVNVRRDSGWYYVMVAPHNGANDPDLAYTLQISLTEGPPGKDDEFELPVFEPLESTQVGKKTIILTNYRRLKERYGEQRSEALRNKLEELATHPAVAGEIIDLHTTPNSQIRQIYNQWDDNLTDPIQANLVTASIKTLLTTWRGAYPDLENILIVGNDSIVPFRRIPDEVPLANESTYHVDDESALAASLKKGYFLSDDYYASFNPIPYRGRALYLPELSIGRLVEEPEEIITAIDTFSQSQLLTVTSALVTGYDFLTDQANAMVDELEQGGVTPDTSLINDKWTAEALRDKWLRTWHSLNFINAHFSHWLAEPANSSEGNVSAAEVRASDTLTGTAVFSVGCHSGLPVEGSEGQQFDFAQALIGKGATYIANTGYGYGDANAIGYSEELMLLFTRYLREGTENGEELSVAQALRQAKTEYFNTRGVDAITPYDEKVLGVATFYGFPMYQIEMPSNNDDAEDAESKQAARAASETFKLSEPLLCPEGLICSQISLTPTYTIQKEKDGTYLSIEGQTQEIPGYPIQPRTNHTIFEVELTNTLEITLPHGLLFEGGQYESESSSDPVITRIITENTVLNPIEPPYFVDSWRPVAWYSINSVRTAHTLKQQLVVIPAQYRSTTPSIGVTRRLTDMTYTIYYGTTEDSIPPSIWQVIQDQESTHIEVDVTDYFSVLRTVATYTTGDGAWETVELTQTDDPNIWEGTLPQHASLEFFVQAVDSGGNVAIHNNKGRYFPPATSTPMPTPTPTGTPTGTPTPTDPGSDIYLPLIRR